MPLYRGFKHKKRATQLVWNISFKSWTSSKSLFSQSFCSEVWQMQRTVRLQNHQKQNLNTPKNRARIWRSERIQVVFAPFQVVRDSIIASKRNWFQLKRSNSLPARKSARIWWWKKCSTGIRNLVQRLNKIVAPLVASISTLVVNSKPSMGLVRPRMVPGRHKFVVDPSVK